MLTYNANNKEVMRIDSNGNIGIGVSASLKVNELLEWTQWIEILENAEKTPAVKQALEHLLTIHNLTKNYE